MRVQVNGYDCGPTALCNALRALGRRLTAEDLAPHCGTTEQHGTTQHGLLQACERMGHGHEVLEAPFREAYPRLRAHMLAGGAAVLNTEGERHWVAAVGVLGERTLVFDGQKSARRGGESGLLALSREQLRRAWDTGRRRYAILVAPR